ncbi:MAG: hypothetical protein SFT81_02905 [Candidatus Caenarcaniphilales bacterium]|nr:hypothetical protein [Candidatus Caenarcaniphilales bacterium]
MKPNSYKISRIDSLHLLGIPAHPEEYLIERGDDGIIRIKESDLHSKLPGCPLLRRYDSNMIICFSRDFNEISGVEEMKEYNQLMKQSPMTTNGIEIFFRLLSQTIQGLGGSHMNKANRLVTFNPATCRKKIEPLLPGKLNQVLLPHLQAFAQLKDSN